LITVCTQHREFLIGRVVVGSAPHGRCPMVLNDAGRMIQAVWNEISYDYGGIEIDAFIMMPNHVDGIVVTVGAGPLACPDTLMVKLGTLMNS